MTGIVENACEVFSTPDSDTESDENAREVLSTPDSDTESDENAREVLSGFGDSDTESDQGNAREVLSGSGDSDTENDQGEDESEDSSSNKMEQWKRGAYDYKYLTLLDKAVSGDCQFGRRFDRLFWDAFTLELNTQIAAEEPDFLDFNRKAVVDYGRFLRNKYNDLKTNPGNLAHFDLLERCFQKCDHCQYIPTFPSVTPEITDIPVRLASLLTNEHLSAGQFWSSLEYFSSNECSARSWLGLSQHCQISTLKSKFPDKDTQVP